MSAFRTPRRYPSVKPLREKTARSRSSSHGSPAMACRQAVTAAATYSGRFMRPSILNTPTPADSISFSREISDMSFRESAYSPPPQRQSSRQG